MSRYLDSSVLVAALVEDEPNHEACLALLAAEASTTWTHALAEVFATLTGGRLGLRVPPQLAAELIEQSLLPRLAVVELPIEDVVVALREAHAVGARGGALYDHLHLFAARKAGVDALFTLNLRHFVALTRHGDPRIRAPH